LLKLNEMIKSDKKVNELAKKLKNPDITAIAATINLLRDEEPFEGAIGLLVNHYSICNEKTIKLLIAGFLNDMKDTGAKKEIINLIREVKKDDVRSMIIASCWQSGLDYSYSIDDFVELIMANKSYDVAFECLTVIEQSVDNIDIKKKNEIITMIKKRISKQPADKIALINELINILT
jgi:hypothetical protein